MCSGSAGLRVAEAGRNGRKAAPVRECWSRAVAREDRVGAVTSTEGSAAAPQVHVVVVVVVVPLKQLPTVADGQQEWMRAKEKAGMPKTARGTWAAGDGVDADEEEV